MMTSFVSEVNAVDASPLRGDLKHPTTPLRPRRKTSRKDQAADVHASCSTPVRTQSKPASSCFSSPSDSFPCSQDHRPDVYWDYTSPKLPKGAKKKEIKITVEEFLKNLSQHEAPDCKSQSSNYIKLLEKWMAKQNTPLQPKPKSRVLKKNNKKRSRRVMDEIRQFMESIQNKSEGGCPGEEDRLQENGKKMFCAHGSHLNISMDKKSFLNADSTDADSADDLWGDMDNSFIIKATQQLDALSKMEMFDRNADVVSTIPETLMNSATETNGYPNEMAIRGKMNINSGVLDADFHAQILLSQIMSQDWDSASDFDEWDNGFIEEDDALSLIPDEVLCGTDVSSSPKNRLNDDVSATGSDQPVKLIDDRLDLDPKAICSQTPVGCSVLENAAADENKVSAELLDDFEDGIFSDEEDSVLSKPEVLSWIDEVENKMSQSPQCTPEEIEKEKEEAVQKRKKAFKIKYLRAKSVLLKKSKERRKKLFKSVKAKLF